MSKPRSSRIFADENPTMALIRQRLMNGLGIPAKELRSKPFVGIANSMCEFNPGHMHLNRIAQAVKNGVNAAGGIPFEFNVPAPCDGIANGNEAMNYILVQRDLIADIIEMYINSQWLDGMVTISSCDKINPGMLMAAARLDIPTICVTGGPNAMNIRFNPASKEKGVDQKAYTEISDKLDTATCATAGSCELMATANTMQSLMEALGMALPFSASAPAYTSKKLEHAREAGKRAVELIKKDIRPSQIMTRESLENAVMVDLAIGGSSNTTLHLPALAYELGIDLDLEIFNHFNKIIPTLCAINPNGPCGVIDLYMAGGIPGVMKRLKDHLHMDCKTISGKTIGEIIKEAKIMDDKVIPEFDKPHFKEGGTAILYGNLAPDGSVVKQSAVAADMLVFSGKAMIFEEETDALKALIKGDVKPGTVMVIRYQGPKGGPGMPEMLSVTTLLDLIQVKEVALITDGRFSGASHGPCIGHVCPEAYDLGPIAALKDGDEIDIDIPNRKLEVKLSDKEIKKRLENTKPTERDIPRGYLRRYRKMVSSAAKGAVLDC